MRLATIPAAVVTLTLAGCGAAEPAPTVTVTATATATVTVSAAPQIGTLAGLRDALVALGYDCPAWEQVTHGWMPMAEMSGTCGDDAMGIYADTDALAAGLHVQRIYDPSSALVRGDVWLLLPRAGASCDVLADSLGATCDRP